MNSGQLGVFLLSRPFEPFAIHLADGRESQVRQPDFVAIAEHSLGLWYLYPSGELELIDVELVSSLRTLGPVDPANFIR